MIIWNPLLSVLVEKAVLLPNMGDNHQRALIVTHMCEIKIGILLDMIELAPIIYEKRHLW
jgi:hypothetical protein